MERKYTVLVTGASGGIGSVIAERFLGEGHRVILHANTRLAAVQRAAEAANGRGRSAFAVQADLTRADEVYQLVQTATKHFGPIEILINNAGIALPQGLLTDCAEADWDRLFAADVKSAFLLTRAALPDMIRKKAGAIVNISSMWGVIGGSCEVPYSAAKAALIGLTKALAKETAGSGVRVNCVAPGFIETDMNAHLSPADVSAFAADTPIGRLGTPADVADAVYFLAMPTASFLTGQVLCVDGGICI